MPRFFEIEQCGDENIRAYRVQGLRLYDEEEEMQHGPVIDLVRSLPGVAHATFEDCHTFVVGRSMSVSWQDAEPHIVDLLRGVTACSDDFSVPDKSAEVAVAVLRAKRVL